MKDKIIKTMIIVVGLLVICGTVGFGIFSYYYTHGSMSMEADTTYASKFNPLISFNSDSYGDFLGEASEYVELNCGDQHEYPVGTEVVCTGTANIKNDGTNKIHVEIYDKTFIPGTDIVNNTILTEQEFTTDYDDFNLDPNESKTVNITVKFKYEYDSTNKEEVEYSQSETAYYTFGANLKVKASEIIE